MQMRQRYGCLATLFGLFVFGLAGVYLLAAVTAPWSFHIGGRWTPLLYWSGSGKLHTKSGTHLLYISFFPSPRFSRLRLDGLRPTGGVKGSAGLCTSRGVIQRLALSGTIYGGWRSTEDSLLEFRLLEPKILDVGQGHGFFDLFGRWHGQELIMDDRGEPGNKFRSGLRIDHASVTLDWGDYSDFKAVCASATDLPAHR